MLDIMVVILNIFEIFFRAAITNATLSSFKNRNLFFHTSGGWESKIKVLASLVSPEASLLGVQTAAFLLCPHVAVPGG